MWVVPEVVEAAVQVVTLLEHFWCELMGMAIAPPNKLGLPSGLVPLGEQGLFHRYTLGPPLVECRRVFRVKDALVVVHAPRRCLIKVQSLHFFVEVTELLFDGSEWHLMNHVCSMCYLRDHEDTPWFTPPLGHHLDDPGCRALVGRPDGDVFTVEVEGDFAHVGCEADHVGESR